MAERFRELPNIEAVAGTALTAAGMRAYSSIPGKDPVYPLIVSMRLGGVPAEKHALDGARLQVETWGDLSTSKGEVFDYCRRALRELLELEGEVIELEHAGERVQVTDVTIETGPQWLPDPRTARPRYLFTLRVSSSSLAPVSS